ncbi:hypothetical protein PG994_007163 [Apiospora phragmitis]|uniref:Uncharacterized protein n=1 Tax=Apiospora phragmitis TaxID=2905665 RepID=A0ABR1V014_9PEZI
MCRTVSDGVAYLGMDVLAAEGGDFGGMGRDSELLEQTIVLIAGNLAPFQSPRKRTGGSQAGLGKNSSIA